MTWQGAGNGARGAAKRLALQGNVFAVTWESSGKAVKAHSGVLCPDGLCFTQVLTPSKMEYGDMARRWQRAAAAGQRVRGDRGKQWQGGKWIIHGQALAEVSGAMRAEVYKFAQDGLTCYDNCTGARKLCCNHMEGEELYALSFSMC